MMGEAKAHGCQQLCNATPPQKNKRRYLHGNHLCYYGYQGCYGSRWEGRVGAEPDPRLHLLQAAWFKDRTVLDIGCGAGHMTLAVARRFGPAHILGLDIDGKLIHAANQNVRHFMSHDLVVEERRRSLNEAQPPSLLGAGPHLKPLPLSLRIARGPLSAPPLLSANSTHSFPHNITFIQGNYLSQEEAWPGRGLYDVILCLGVTKYVQLQSGDLGLVTLFKRAYQSLSPGGLLILEPQPWSSYRHRRRVSEAAFHHHSALKLRPQQFTSYLTDNVGFSSYTLLTHTGNNRPIYLFNKGPAHRK
ncbi:7SK snRNA methylphosphate capping enzyme-like isoform X2 [Gouania willdenowi]|uniref:7SK snRNA methylphosphate capping enzyme-like isoform X2 n=1 Tax=Gouania willdenowi TaxID=441366 RepID=UPI00105583E4|nr:7SK snRNA methylphosphate capping enzyme-like isoform X2 [Gouania willdenowi]